MKFYSLILFTLLSFSLTTQAKTKDLSYRPLVAKIQKSIKANILKAKKETQLLKFTVSPNVPKVQEEVTAFIQPLTGFTDSDILLEAYFDSVNVTANLEQPAKELWVIDLGKFSEIKAHNLFVKIFLQDRNAATLITDAIKALDQAITDLNEQIDAETDPAIIADLTEQRNDKIAQKNELVATLASLKTQIGEENYSFNIVADNTLTNYPKIDYVNPNVIKNSGGTSLTVFGSNFTATPILKIDGVAQTTTSATNTEITFVSPALFIGPHNLEVSTVSNGEVRNVFLNNAFFATSNDLANPNTPPTAVATIAASPILLGATAQLNATNSFDSNEKPIRFEWRFLSVPESASVVAGNTVVSVNENFSFVPNVPGFYVVELKVIQQQNLQLSSAPTYAVLEVTAPANRAVSATAGSILMPFNQQRTLQIAVTDLDFWQKHSFVISTQSNFGTTTVSSNGLITFTSGSVAGSDEIKIVVIDDGNPALSAVVTIPVSVVNNLPPITGTTVGVIRSEGLPALVTLVANTASDPDGTIAKIQFNAGDGTTDYASVVAGANFGLVNHNYQAFGSYNASVTVTDNLGTSTTTNFVVNVVDIDLPSAKFSLNTYSCSAPCTILANASESQHSVGITQYRWFWGDNTAEEIGSGSGFITRSHTYNNNGTYRIRLRTRDINRAQGEGFATVYVGVTAPVTGSPPSSDFVVYPNRQAQIGANLFFTADRSFDPNPSGSITNYAWNFGQGSASGESVNFSYTLPTNFFPFVTTTNALGGTSASTQGEVFIVTTATGQAPRALFSVNDVLAPLTVSGTAPFTVNVNSNLSYDYDGTIVSRLWNFGDSTTATTESATKIYTTPGVYFLNLRVTDNDGNFPGKFQMITVNPPSFKAQKIKTRSEDSDFDDKQNLTSACGQGSGEACYLLAKIYESEGNVFVAEKLMERACGLNYALACGKK